MKKKIVGIIVIACILAVIAFAAYKVLSSMADKASAKAQEQTEAVVERPVACVNFAGTFLSLDMNGCVCDNTSSRPLGIPLITGIEFTEAVYGQQAVTENTSGLSYVLKVGNDLDKNGIRADEIRFASGTVTVVIDKLLIKLGRNDRTDDKINDLSDFIDKVYGKSGTLNMQNANINNYGYTFRENE